MGDGYILDPSYPCRFKVRFLRDEYSKAFLDWLQRQNRVLIAKTGFRIVSVQVRSKSYQDILNEAQPSEAFRLIFKSPTYLAAKGAGFHSLFPEPRRVFLYLATLWNLHAGEHEITGMNEYADWLKQNLGVTGYELKTRFVTFGKKQTVGFTGWVNYRMREMGERNKLTCALASFAELSNVGANRTGGFGVTKYETKAVQESQP